MKVNLTNSKAIFKVSRKDYEKVFSCNWYAIGKRIQICTTINNRIIYIANFILGNPPRGFVWDHKDRDVFNNCRTNFRLASKSQNGANTGKYKNNTSGFKGVYKDGEIWKAQITKKGYKKHIGRFNSPKEAAKAYDIAAKKYHGGFAVLNFPRVEL